MNNRRQLMNIAASSGTLVCPSLNCRIPFLHHTLNIIPINLYTLKNFSRLNILRIQKMHFRTLFTVGRIDNRLKHFECYLTHVSTAQSDYNGLTGLTTNQRLGCDASDSTSVVAVEQTDIYFPDMLRSFKAIWII
ncbi:hypothetical protein TNCV_4242251 [Trichonephila clavipes]|nr:hypothetical protein TNCV_4242251 [Trichonephila clavipes]